MEVLLKQIRYALYLIFHPFQGFWDIKKEGKGSIRAASAILFFFILSQVIKRQYTAYLYNPSDPLTLNIFTEVLQLVVFYFLWNIANWCLTTLMDGEGTFKEICIATAYALTPMILLDIPLAALSNAFTSREAAIYLFVSNLALLWTGFLILCSVLVTHQYSLFKTIVTSILIFVVIGIIIFIGLLFFNLIQQMMGFALNLVKEFQYR